MDKWADKIPMILSSAIIYKFTFTGYRLKFPFMIW